MSIKAKPKRRVRRPPEVARQKILDAAETVLATKGPAGTRLTDVARMAGVSHPTVLHYFGSQAGLVAAVNQRTGEELQRAIRAMFETRSAATATIVTTMFAAYRGGLAQRLAWLLQQPQSASGIGTVNIREALKAFVSRTPNLKQPDRSANSQQMFMLMQLAILVAFADALIGPRLRGSLSEPMEADARKEFEHWFAAVIDRVSST